MKKVIMKIGQFPSTSSKLYRYKALKKQPIIKLSQYTIQYQISQNNLPKQQSLIRIMEGKTKVQKSTYQKYKNIQKVIQNNYALSEVKILRTVGGYADINFLVVASIENSQNNVQESEKKFIFKVSHPSVQQVQIQLQNYVIKYLNNKNFELLNQISQQEFSSKYFQIVKLISSKLGSFYIQITQNQKQGQEEKLFGRLFEYIQDAIQFNRFDQNNYTQKLFEQIGTSHVILGQKTANLIILMKDLQYENVLQKLENNQNNKNVRQNLQRSNQNSPWNLSNFQKNTQDLHYLKDQQTIKIIDTIFDNYSKIKAHLLILPKQIIHSDVCSSNILLAKRNNEQLYPKTLIDFGDLNYSAALYQLIVASTRQVMFQTDPLRNIIAVLRGYNKITKIDHTLLHIFYPLIMARYATIYIISQKNIILTSKQEKEMMKYLVQTRNDVYNYLITYSKFTNQQFLERLTASLKVNE